MQALVGWSLCIHVYAVSLHACVRVLRVDCVQSHIWFDAKAMAAHVRTCDITYTSIFHTTIFIDVHHLQW